MQCPKCHAKVGIVHALLKRKAEFSCLVCGSRLRLTGYWWGILLPSIVVLVFPFDQLKETAWMLVALSVSYLAISVVVFRVMVGVQMISETSTSTESDEKHD